MKLNQRMVAFGILFFLVVVLLAVEILVNGIWLGLFYTGLMIGLGFVSFKLGGFIGCFIASKFPE